MKLMVDTDAKPIAHHTIVSPSVFTFITPWGRYRYKTAPQGYIASGDWYTRRYGEPETECVDDVLLWPDPIEERFVYHLFF